MQIALAPALALLASCSTTDASTQPSPLAAQAGHPSLYFPTPKQGLTFQVTADRAPRLQDLLNEFSRVTGQTFVADPATRQQLEGIPCGLNQSVEVPAAQVYGFTESILAYHGFFLRHLRTEEPRLLGIVWSKQWNEGGVASKPIYVPVEELPAWKDHPAFLVQTVLSVPHVDARVMANSMRAMFGDNRMQQILPTANANTLVLSAPASVLDGLVAALRRCDEEAKQQSDAHEAAAKSAPPAPATAPAQPTPPK